MQIIAGSARGVPLQTVPDNDTRPILDRVKKSLFSILDAAGRLVDARVMDLYSGTGTQGLEALSRGAVYALFVEKRADAVKLLHANLAKTKLAEGAEVRQADVGQTIAALDRERTARPEAFKPFDVIFHDPPFPYSREDATRAAIEAELALAGKLLAPEGWMILRMEKKIDPPKALGLDLFRHWTDGPHALCFYQRAQSS